MNNLESLKPKSVNRLMDMVRKALIDVSDWVNFKDGVHRHFSRNLFGFKSINYLFFIGYF